MVKCLIHAFIVEMSYSNLLNNGKLHAYLFPGVVHHFFSKMWNAPNTVGEPLNLSSYPTYEELIEELNTLKQRVTSLEAQNTNTNTNTGSVATEQTFHTAKSRKTRRRRRV